MATATLNLNIDYGSSWEFEATFPLTVSLVDTVIEVEVGQKKNFSSDEALISLITPTNITITGQVVSFRVSASDLLAALGSTWTKTTYHWRFYITWTSGRKDEVMCGNFVFNEGL